MATTRGHISRLGNERPVAIDKVVYMEDNAMPRSRHSSGVLVLVAVALLLTSIVGSSALYLWFVSNPKSPVESNWVTEIVDSSQPSAQNFDRMGRWLSMDLDGGESPHISYSYLADGSQSSLKYATRIDGAWQIETVDNGNRAGSWNWIELDSEERPNIVYQDGSSLMLATKSGDWSFEEIDVGRPTYPTLAFRDIEKTSHPVVAYYGGLDYTTLRVAEKDATGWKIDDLGLVGVSPSMALGPDGHIHLIYLTSEDIVYAERAQGVWSSETVAPTRTTLDAGSIKVDVSGTVHVAYDDNHVLYYAVKQGGEWNIETVDDGLSSTFRSVSLSLQSNGLPAICYLRSGEATLAWKTIEGWQRERIGEASGDLFMVLDSRNTPHVAFHLETRSQGKGEASLRYAYRNSPLFEGSRSSCLDVSGPSFPLPGIDETQISDGHGKRKHR